MKNFLSLLCIFSLCVGCDKAYDLNKIESGDVTIGNDQSEWIMPLAQITVGMDELQDGSADIRAIFDEVDIWLPTTLPGNAEWVDIVRLSSDGTYLDGMLEALIDEMLVPGSKKMDEVVDLIWSNEGYRERFTALIPADSEELFKAEFKKFFGEDNEAGEALRDTMGELAREFLSQIKINTITYNATLDVDDDLIDMLADNLDPDGTVGIEVVGKHIDQIIVDIQRRIISNRIDFNLGKKFPRQLAHRIAQRFASLVVLAEKLLEFRLEKLLAIGRNQRRKTLAVTFVGPNQIDHFVHFFRSGNEHLVDKSLQHSVQISSITRKTDDIDPLRIARERRRQPDIDLVENSADIRTAVLQLVHSDRDLRQRHNPFALVVADGYIAGFDLVQIIRLVATDAERKNT